MAGQETPSQIDSLLRPFLEAADEAESQHRLSQLVSEHAEPLIKQIIRYKLRVQLSYEGESVQHQDAEDVYSEVLVRLLKLMQQVKAHPREHAIGNFRSYVAVATYRACYEHLRQKYPQRWRLKNRVRYLLTHHPGLALWEGENQDWYGGLTKWRTSRPSRGHTARLFQLLNEPQAFAQVGLSDADLPRSNPAEVLKAVFKWVGGPVELDDLVTLVADWWGIKDQTTSVDTSEGGPNDWREGWPDSRLTVEAEVEQRLYLRRLWSEVRQLPPRQRSALLLNLRDEQGSGIIELLPLTGIATIREIAAAVEMPAEEFAGLWSELPLDDAAIAAHLGLTRQQVINLRKSARERLARRMRALDKAVRNLSAR